jgi:lysylphosphatidylglycerol synthase-like protein
VGQEVLKVAHGRLLELRLFLCRLVVCRLRAVAAGGGYEAVENFPHVAAKRTSGKCAAGPRAEVLAVFAFARLVTAIPITPGGAGLVEAALIGGLIGAGGDKSQVAAAVLIYRALTWALPILVGIGCYLWWRRSSIRPGLLKADGPPVAGTQH